MVSRTIELLKGMMGEGSALRCGTVRYPHAGRESLICLLAAMEARSGAEIGVWKGGFSAKLCAAMPNLTLTCVDPWRAYGDYQEQKNDPVKIAAAYEEAKERLAPFKCRIYRMPSLEAAERVGEGSLDFVYLDGNHRADYVLDDIAAWLPKVRKGGVFSGHDYADPNPRKPAIEVKAAVDEYVAQAGIRPFFVLAGDKTPSFLWVV